MLTKLFLPGMTKQGYGRIALLISTASFQPVPGNAVYGAAKAFIYNYSRAIRYELRDTMFLVNQVRLPFQYFLSVPLKVLPLGLHLLHHDRLV